MNKGASNQEQAKKPANIIKQQTNKKTFELTLTIKQQQEHSITIAQNHMKQKTNENYQINSHTQLFKLKPLRNQVTKKYKKNKKTKTNTYFKLTKQKNNNNKKTNNNNNNKHTNNNNIQHKAKKPTTHLNNLEQLKS